MCGFDEFRRSNYFRGEPIRRTEVEVRVEKFKDEVTGEMIKGGGDKEVDWIWGCVMWPLRVMLCLKIGDLV